MAVLLFSGLYLLYVQEVISICILLAYHEILRRLLEPIGCQTMVLYIKWLLISLCAVRTYEVNQEFRFDEGIGYIESFLKWLNFQA